MGYQAPGTLGRRLVDGARMVRVRGREVPVNARIHTLGGFSAHAGRRELIDWLGAIAPRPKRIFLVHGEEPAMSSFGAAVEAELGVPTHRPAHGEAVEL